MRRILLILALMATIVASCAQAESEQPIDSISIDSINTEPSREDIADMPEETLSIELQQAILEAVGEHQNLPPNQLQITAVESADWPDACLGLAAPGEFCAQMITPGWAVTVTNGQQTWQYRTDLDITQVKLADT